VVDMDEMHKFWNKYVDSSTLERDKLLKNMVKFNIWQELLKIKKSKRVDGLTLQEYCLKTHLQFYFDDLIEYMQSR